MKLFLRDRGTYNSLDAGIIYKMNLIEISLIKKSP